MVLVDTVATFSFELHFPLHVAGIERDAVSIFAKYIAKDAPKPIGVDDALRGETISKWTADLWKPPLDEWKVCQLSSVTID